MLSKRRGKEEDLCLADCEGVDPPRSSASSQPRPARPRFDPCPLGMENRNPRRSRICSMACEAAPPLGRSAELFLQIRRSAADQPTACRQVRQTACPATELGAARSPVRDVRLCSRLPAPCSGGTGTYADPFTSIASATGGAHYFRGRVESFSAKAPFMRLGFPSPLGVVRTGCLPFGGTTPPRR